MSWKLDYVKTTNKDDAYKVVKENITAETIEKFKVSAEVNPDDSQQIITAIGKGFTLTLEFEEKTVNCNLKLSFLLKPLTSKLQHILSKEINRVI